MIDIRPDPKHPRGGFAEVTLSEAEMPSDTSTVSVFNSYQQKWLGPSGWQANKASFPVRAAHQDGDALRLILGPDIVNHVEEDTPIRLEIGDQSWDTYWPDDINSGPDEAVIGNIGGTGAAPEAKVTPTVVTTPEPEVAQADLSQTEAATEDEPADAEDQAETPPEPTPASEGKSRMGAILGGVAAVVALGLVAFFLLTGDDPAPEPAPLPDPVAAVEPLPDPAPEPDLCDLTDVQGQAFLAVADKMRSCSGSLSADDALRAVEQSAAQNDPDALNMFGALYDSGVTDDAIEGTIGLSFEDKPDRAAEYYHRAVAAGSEEAATRLKAVCLRLALKTDTLSQSAREDYCQ